MHTGIPPPPEAATQTPWDHTPQKEAPPPGVDPPLQMATAADSMHPTEMHSTILFLWSAQTGRKQELSVIIFSVISCHCSSFSFFFAHLLSFGMNMPLSIVRILHFYMSIILIMNTVN